MKNRWIAIVGALLLGSVLGCGDSGQTVTAPSEDSAPPPTEAPSGPPSSAAPLDLGATPKAP